MGTTHSPISHKIHNHLSSAYGHSSAIYNVKAVTSCGNSCCSVHSWRFSSTPASEAKRFRRAFIFYSCRGLFRFEPSWLPTLTAKTASWHTFICFLFRLFIQNGIHFMWHTHARHKRYTKYKLQFSLSRLRLSLSFFHSSSWATERNTSKH